MDLSVVIPLLNEEESLHELYARIDKVCKEHHYTYEIWFVDDGSTDTSWQIIDDLSKENNHKDMVLNFLEIMVNHKLCTQLLRKFKEM